MIELRSSLLSGDDNEQYSKSEKNDQGSNRILSYGVQHRGSNLSLGQRQLVCIARALVQKPKILLMDEATASIDEKTDRIIQNIIKHKLEGTTVVTIAHRLETVIQYDKILVLDKGEKLEEGSPEELLKREGEFYRMVQEGGVEFMKRMVHFSKNKNFDL